MGAEKFQERGKSGPKLIVAISENIANAESGCHRKAARKWVEREREGMK